MAKILARSPSTPMDGKFSQEFWVILYVNCDLQDMQPEFQDKYVCNVEKDSKYNFCKQNILAPSAPIAPRSTSLRGIKF